MSPDDLTRSTLNDLLETGQLYLRRQCSLLVLRVSWDRAATRLRLPSPEDSLLVRSFVDLLDHIDAACPPERQYREVGAVIDRLRGVVRTGGLASPASLG